MVADVSREDHPNYYLSNGPVLRFREQFEYVVFRIHQNLKSNGAVVVLQNRHVVVSQSLLVLHPDQKVVVYSRMSHIVQHSR